MNNPEPPISDAELEQVRKRHPDIPQERLFDDYTEPDSGE